MIFNIIAPIFLLIAIGFGIAHFKVTNKDFPKQMMTYLFWISGPAIIFDSISNSHMSQLLSPEFWLAYPLSVLLITIISVILYKATFKTSMAESINASFAVAIKNTLLIGFPILLGLTGKHAAIPTAICVIFFSCVASPILILFYELQKRLQGNQATTTWSIISDTLKGTLKNPFIIATILGLLFAALGIHQPYIMSKTISYIAPSFIPCALIAVGVELRAFKMEGNINKIITVSALNLVLTPAIAIILSYALHLSDFYATALVLYSALPTAKSLFIYAAKYEFYEQEIAAIISVTSVASIATIPLFIGLCYHLWPTAFLSLG